MKTKIAACRYVQDWKAEEGLPEDAIRSVVQRAEGQGGDGGREEEKEIGNEPEVEVEIEGGGEKVDLSELAEFMIERSRK